MISVACSKTEYKELRVYPVLRELSIARGDDSFIAIQVEIPAGFHIYGNPKGPGIGKPTQIFVRSPRDMIVHTARYLQSTKFYYPNEKDYTLVYDNETKIFVPFKVPEHAHTGIHSLEITFDSLMCNYADTGGFANPASVCIPKIIQFDYTIRVLPKGSSSTTYQQSIISDYTISKAPGVQYETIQGMQSAAKTARDASLSTELQFSPRFIQSRISGLLEAILFGILAGFLLNFMPCVLPVVSLKVVSFVQHADKNRREVFLLGLIFSLGILTSFAVLASLAAFFGYKWGGLFQHRIFLVVMTGFVFALALSLFGVYTINIPAFAGRAAKQRENIFIDAYIKGLLATLLATPCSGPFLGGALAWTLSKPSQIIFMVFMSIGFGMSLPYLILTINPKFLKFIPKPGEWIKTFEQIMAFLLVFTTVYLLGIFDPATIMPVMAFLAFVAVGFWQYGRYGSIVHSKKKRLASFIFLIMIIAGGYWLSFNYLYTGQDIQEISQSDYSVSRMLENRAAGRISMIEFTAAWCPNCRLVEKTSLFTTAVLKALNAESIDFMKADITSKNPAAEQLLSLFHTQSIPVLAVIPPGASFEKPIILRDIYTEGDVLEAIAMAMKNGKKVDKINYKVEMNLR